MIPYHGKTLRTVNYLKTIYFDHPDWTPCSVSLMPATWMRYREALEELVLRHPRLFPGYQRGDRDYDYLGDVLYEGGQHTDSWGTVWDNVAQGLSSHPVEEPLSDWAAFDSWTPPDPLTQAEFGPRDWDQVASNLSEAREKGHLVSGGGLLHGCMYMRLYYLRGFDNLMLDLALGDPRIYRLIDIVLDYNVTVIRKYLELGVEQMGFGDDLGLQKSLPISPNMWRQVLKPCFEAMYGPCRDRDIPVSMHSDGHILEIVPDLVDTGVRVINPQIRANGLAGLRDLKGTVTIHIDLDRQLFPFATADQIREHIHQVHDALYMPEGGLSMHAECEPDVSLENIEVICSTLEEIGRLPDASLE